jgi:Fe-S oxidoreductase
LEIRLLNLLKENYPSVDVHKICCRREPCVEIGTKIINVCPGCDLRFGSLYEGVETISVWEILDRISSFPFPDYKGAVMTVHDSCPIKSKPKIHASIRSLLGKMNINVKETEHHSSNSVCCGDDFYPSLPVNLVHVKIRSRADSMPCRDVVVYCVTCLKAMSFGGKTPRYFLDLLFDEETVPGFYDTAKWREDIQLYADRNSKNPIV